VKAEVLLTRAYRERLLKDAYRPAYHFATPDDKGMPGDTNGAFFADGVYAEEPIRRIPKRAKV
jgi:beta-fructofuranosidase